MVRKNKQLVFDRQAEIVKAMAHPIRIAVLDFLKDGPQCVCNIAAHVRSERSNVSRHLSVMTSAGLLESYKDGLKVIYRLKRPCILDFFSCIERCIMEHAKDEQKLLKSLR
ncbi:MAG: metalloregulator ArsR/SmtB family transcription factor [Phycisphaerae bacterium]|jgi:ArsR family transcriptional regulator